MLPKLAFTLFTVAVSVKAQNTLAGNFVSLAPMGNVAVLQLGVETWLYYQDMTGAIRENGLRAGTFVTAHTTVDNLLIAPADQVLVGTPIAVAAIPVGDSTLEEHMYFLSPSFVLSEYRWDNGTGQWSGGSSCQNCVDRAGFQVAESSGVLYALQDPSTNALRVGFVSPEKPGTLVEVLSTNSGASWALTPLPA